MTSNINRCGRILGRTAKNRLHAEGLLVTNRAWNQASEPMKKCEGVVHGTKKARDLLGSGVYGQSLQMFAKYWQP